LIETIQCILLQSDINGSVMKRITSAVILIFILALDVSSQEEETGLLWEIDGNGLRSPSYLFGTLHFIPKKDFFLTPQIKQKMRECKILSTETLMNHHTRNELDRNAHLKEDLTIEDLMSSEDYAKVRNFFIANLKVSKLKFDLTYTQLKPMVLSTTIIRIHIGRKVKFYEDQLIRLAKKYDMETLGLETIEQEVEAMNHYPLKEQAEALVHNVENFQQHFDNYEAIIDYYKEGDLSMILNITMQPFEDNKEFHRHFIDLRNLDWLPKMERKMSLAPTFFAVGAAHLPGPTGLIKLLRTKGYTVTPVEIKVPGQNKRNTLPDF